MTRKQSSQMKIWIAALAIFMLVVSACTPATKAPAAPTEEPAPAATEEPAPAVAFDLDAILANAGGDCQEPTGDPLRIGYVGDFSELGGFADIPGTKAAGYMAELINCAGGINGTPVEVKVFPADATDLDLTLRAAQDAVDAGVHAVLGPPFSDVGLPLLNVLGGKIPAIHVSSTEVVLADPSNYSFLMTFTDAVQGHAAGEWAFKNGYKTAVIMTSDVAPYFEANPTAFAEAFSALGGEVLGDFSYTLGDDDYSSQVNEIAALDSPPDLLYTANIMPFIDVLVGQLRAAGLTDMLIMGPDGFDATRVIDGETTDGVVYTTHGFPSPGSRMKIFLDAYEAEKGEALESIAFGPLAADAVLTISQAYLASGKLDSIAIGDAMLAMESFDLISVDSASYQRSGGPDGTVTRDVYIVQNVASVPTLLDQFIPQD
ncbi:MAG: ABC transporter substrate-binding protein [Anaerolineae bacterium]